MERGVGAGVVSCLALPPLGRAPPARPLDALVRDPTGAPGSAASFRREAGTAFCSDSRIRAGPGGHQTSPRLLEMAPRPALGDACSH